MELILFVMLAIWAYGEFLQKLFLYYIMYMHLFNRFYLNACLITLSKLLEYGIVILLMSNHLPCQMLGLFPRWSYTIDKFYLLSRFKCLFMPFNHVDFKHTFWHLFVKMNCSWFCHLCQCVFFYKLILIYSIKLCLKDKQTFNQKYKFMYKYAAPKDPFRTHIIYIMKTNQQNDS